MQVFANKEKIGKLTKTGNTTVQLASSVITIGAKQYTTGNLVCDLSLSGAGGLDSGAFSTYSIYHIYIVIDAGSPKLIASLSKNNPTGFSKNKRLGTLITDSTAVIKWAASIGEKIVNEKKIATSISGSIPATYTTVPNLSFSMVTLSNSVLVEGAFVMQYIGVSDTNRCTTSVDGVLGEENTSQQTDGNEFVKMHISQYWIGLTQGSHLFEIKAHRSSVSTNYRTDVNATWMRVREELIID